MSCLIKISSKNELTLEKIKVITENLKIKLLNRVEEAYIFGSVARNQFTRDSDIDLLLIKETPTCFIERSKEFSDLFETYPRLDILVYTPSEFKKQLEDSHFGFWKSVKESLVKIL